MLTWLVVGNKCSCGQLPRSGSFGQGCGRLERNSLRARRPRGQRHKTTRPRAPTPGSHRRLGCCYRNARCTHETEIKHPSRTRPSRLGLLPRSLWQHAGNRAAGEARGGAARGYSLHRGARAAGCAAAGLAGAARSCGAWRSGRAAREVEPGASPLPARTLSSPRGLKVNARALPAPSLRVKREAIG